MDAADSNYSFNPWMNPEVRPGDNVDPSQLLSAEETVVAVASQVPFPAPAGPQPRFLGMERTQPRIEDVLQVGPVAPLMHDTETRQESGQPGTLRNSTPQW